MKDITDLFENIKAHNAWIAAIKIIGGPAEASRKSGIPQCQISLISRGRKIKDTIDDKKGCVKRIQSYPTAEYAIKISLLTDGKISAERLKPGYDFKYIYKYAKIRGK